MKRQRWMISTPGQFVSTMKAVVAFGLLVDGVFAITTIMPAFVPFVHHSFSPLRMKNSPFSSIFASVRICAGSEPTSFSVNAKALISPFAQRGRYFIFCSSVPNRINGCGAPMD